MVGVEGEGVLLWGRVLQGRIFWYYRFGYLMK
jgi:hypothetical protein